MDRRLERTLTREEKMQLEMEAANMSVLENISYQEAKRYKEEELAAEKKRQWLEEVSKRSGKH